MKCGYSFSLRAIQLLLILCIFYIPTHTCKAEPPTKIGVILPLTGELALFGEKVRRGIELAASDGQGEFDLIFEDSASSPVKAVTAFQKLTSIDSVKFIIGPAGPGETLAVAPLAVRKRVTLIAISLCDPRFRLYSVLFCTYPAIREQVSSLFAEFGIGRKLVSTMAVLVEESEIGDSYFDLLSTPAKESGIQLVFAVLTVDHNTAEHAMLL